MTLRETLERLGAMPAFVEAALHEAGEENLGLRPSGDTFALVEQACHLRDLEREGYLVRVRRMLAESEPALEPFDGGAIAAARDYPSQDARRAAREFAAARHELTRLIAPLTPQQLRLEGTFGGRRVCFADVIAMMVEHDAGHRAEIEQLLAGLG